MKTNSFLQNLLLVSLCILGLAGIYLVGYRLGGFLAELNFSQMSSIEKIGAVGYSLSLTAIPVLLLVLLYKTYRFIRK